MRNLNIGLGGIPIFSHITVSRQNWTPIEIGPVGPFLTSKSDPGGSNSDACTQSSQAHCTCFRTALASKSLKNGRDSERKIQS